MRTVKSTVPILLAIATLTSVVFIATPISVFAPGAISHPHGTTIDVTAGDNFTLRYRLYWDEPEDGMYSITLVWINYENKPEENLTFISASAYFDNSDTITTDVTLDSTPDGANTKWILSLDSSSYPSPYNDNFWVDIKMGAYGEGGVWHKPTDNHPILAPLPFTAVSVAEFSIVDVEATKQPITVRVIGAGVIVDITPASKSGWTGENLTYTVTVTNKGQRADNYTVTVSDDLGWTQKGIIPTTNFLNVAENENRYATLWVVVESGTDTLTVKADGVYADNSDTCTAVQKTGLNVDVTASPAYSDILPGDNANITVVVKNTGTVSDNFNVTFSDTQTWTLPAGYTVELDPVESDTRVVQVGVPGAAVPCTTDDVTVTATSEDDVLVKDSATVQVHAKAAVNVLVKPIVPAWQENCPSKPLCYCVEIQNTGMATDNYEVVLSDTLDWNPTWAIVVKLYPPDDTYTMEGAPDNIPEGAYGYPGGKKYNMYNGYDALPYYKSERIYTKFDMSGISASKICKATLWVESKYGPSSGAPLFVDTWHLVDALPVENDDWSEDTLTWNMAVENHPMGTTVLDTDNFAGDLFVGQYKWYSWDVTSFVIDEFEDDKIASIGLKRQDPEDEYPSAGWLYTADGGNAQKYWPYLEVTYIPGTSNTIQLSLKAGENATVCFGVIVSASATPCENDVITVTATSKTDNTVKDSETCIAHAKKLAIVDVEVTPDSQEAHASVVDYLVNPQVRFDPLTYKVAVTNLGQLDDKYELTVTDTRGWGLKVDPSEFFVPAGDTEYASLSVTVPEDTWAGTTDTITVTATGKLATFKQVVIGPSDKDSVLAIAGLVHGVQMEVLPDCEPQTGAPGSPLVWLVVIKNTGNAPNEFVLTVSDVTSGVSSASDRPDNSWHPMIRPIPLTLDPCTKATTYLDVTVPDDAKTCEWDTITVKVSGIGAMDEITVKAHALEPGPRIPEGVVEIAVEAEVIAIDVWPPKFDFRVMDEDKVMNSWDNYIPQVIFTVRNTGNVPEDILARGTDAQSMPGEPVTTWTLSDASIGIDQYMLRMTIVDVQLSKADKLAWGLVAPGTERTFGLEIRTPSVITTPARMWARVKLTAVAA